VAIEAVRNKATTARSGLSNDTGRLESGTAVKLYQVHRKPELCSTNWTGTPTITPHNNYQYTPTRLADSLVILYKRLPA
jgi:hypothetical protein